MKRTIATAALIATLASLTGCANMTPEQQQAAAAAFGGALGAVGAAYSQPRYYTAPVYVAPMPMPTRTTCRRSYGALVCDTW